MQVILIGGTGQIGYAAACELCARGHTVKAVALPPLPAGMKFPKSMRVTGVDFTSLSDEQLGQLFSGCDGFVFAAGINENFEAAPSIEEYLARREIFPLRHMLSIAKNAGVNNVVLLGSYLTYFNRIWTDLALNDNTYVRVCEAQTEAALSFADGHMNVSILELPPVIGGDKYSQPLLMPLVAAALEDQKRTLVSKGGTSLITVNQAAQAVAGALERNRGGHCYPVGYFNMSWLELTQKIHVLLDNPDKKIRTLSSMTMQNHARQRMLELEKQKIACVIDPMKIIPFRLEDAYIDMRTAVERLGVIEDDFDISFKQTVSRCASLIKKS